MMTKTSTGTDSSAIDAYINALPAPLGAQITTLRHLLLALTPPPGAPAVAEQIKWHAPSFYCRDHFATIGPTPDKQLQLILHCGAKKRQPRWQVRLVNPPGFLRVAASDRVVLTLNADLDLSSLRPLLQSWLDQQPAD
ncbi:MAG: hypothetical protein U5L02_18650 [Rheinheimera sp.]|nr:hypothetical protein [Rheinheimera sp.]